MSYDLILDMQDLNAKLSKTLDRLKDNKIAYEQAEMDYKIKLRLEVVRLREVEKMPVTMIPLVVYGVPEIARLRFARGSAEAVLEANREAINTYKLQMRMLDAQIQREWGRKDG